MQRRLALFVAFRLASGLAAAYDLWVAARTVDCTIVTCERVPDLDADDRLLVAELQSRGLTAAIGVWSDPSVDWSATRLCLVRSTWDYHHNHRRFVEWIGRASAMTLMRNDPRLLIWNAHKSYLLELERCGVRVVPTHWLQQGRNGNLAGIAQARGWGDLVLKPARGAAAHEVTLVRADALAAGQARLDALLQRTDVLVQPYLAAVTDYGERALIFFQGRYSHAVVKKPFDTMLVVGDEPSLRVEPSAAEMEVALGALACVPGEPVYSRVDLLRDDAGLPRVSEVELIEPGLYFSVHEPARRRFADVIERELKLHCGKQ